VRDKLISRLLKTLAAKKKKKESGAKTFADSTAKNTQTVKVK